MGHTLYLRALERSDLRFVHELNNNQSIMSYWFEEPYESFDELEELYNKHIHDNAERRFVAEDSGRNAIGLVELIEIDYIHRSAEFQIIITPDHQGKGFARSLIRQALHYSFTILNLHKVYLIVAVENVKAIHLYAESGFTEEGHLVQEFFINGKYRDVKRMYILQNTYLDRLDTMDASEPNWLYSLDGEDGLMDTR
ncbi:spermidine N1-acetyltransferase [Vreelandella salicampi]|uniref:Spermidine N(1)-acetyltransferase n=1 Tax=Vreelandella salicampi TaxID=1449798 RepID=A0A7Z0RWI0_9GAMM|nr:spermidine N1-acetyltransferase [Halomonas salicampi]NYS62245.1 spermidine N1-acetyltransferase [Halomonas salicampi]